MTSTNRNSRQTTKGKSQNDYHVGLIPPNEIWGRPLPGRFIHDADLPFEERVERAWARLKAGFEEDEHERLREVLVEMIEGDRRSVMPAKEVKRA